MIKRQLASGRPGGKEAPICSNGQGITPKFQVE